MQTIETLLDTISGLVWGLPLVFLLVGMGLWLTLRLGLIQLRGFTHAFRVIRGDFDSPDDPGELSHFQALATALSATVGLGNIAGVAIAVSLGGPGATFWMMVAGFLGMATKYTECTLAVMYRKVDERGVVHGGPMHYIVRGLGEKWRPLAIFFAFACLVASFGASNMFQTNQVAEILSSQVIGIPKPLTGMVLALLTGVVIIGGIKSIGRVAGILVPVMGLLYVGGALVVLVMNIEKIPDLFGQIFTAAFTGSAAAGGFIGTTVKETMIMGVRRAVFSNEAGLGSAPIAHAAAATNEPVREGVVALLEPFIDTVIICTLTALVVLATGTWQEQGISGVEITAHAFDMAFPGKGYYFIAVAVTLFAYSTVLSWSYYGERAIDFLFGDNPKAILTYRLLYCVAAFGGAIWTLKPVLAFSDIMLGLMVVPNLLAVFLLLPKVIEASEKYFAKLRKGEFPLSTKPHPSTRPG